LTQCGDPVASPSQPALIADAIGEIVKTTGQLRETRQVDDAGELGMGILQ
jgi:hypothetical protein